MLRRAGLIILIIVLFVLMFTFTALNTGQIEILGDVAGPTLPDEYKPLAQILSGVLDDLGRLYESLDRNYDDADWVGYRFAEILPITAEQKQSCLEAEDPVRRLELMREVLESVRGPENDHPA